MIAEYPPKHPAAQPVIIHVRRIHGRADLTLTDGAIISMPRAMLAERPYRSGMPFDRDAFYAFLKDRSYAFALERAVSLLAIRARTEQEIVDALRRSAYPETVVARVMQRLGELGYLNDGDFARQWVAARSAKGIGSRRLHAELRLKGVHPEQIDSALSTADQEGILTSAALAAKKALRGKNPACFDDRRKVIAALMRKGHDYSTAQKALAVAIEESQSGQISDSSCPGSPR